MALRGAKVKIDGKWQLVLVEKLCDSTCPCEKGNTSPASITLAELDPKCSLQQIPHLVHSTIYPQIKLSWETLSETEFLEYCKSNRDKHRTEFATSVRELANPFNTYSHAVLAHKLWNEQATKLFSEYIDHVNAIIQGNAMTLPIALPREPTFKHLAHTLQGGFTIERLCALIDFLIPELERLRNLPKEKQVGRGPNGQWKSAFPAVTAALIERGYMTSNVADRVLASLFSKQFGISISDGTMRKVRSYANQTFTNGYYEQALAWLDSENP